jgi:hypothetical protein
MRRVCVVLLTSLTLVWDGSARAELVVAISKSEQRLSVLLDGAEAYRWTISTGRASHPTPSGTFRPIRFEPDWYSHKYDNAPMPWSVFFHGGYAVHGTLEVSHLGRAASHGCVRLKPDEAHTLYSLIRREGAERTRITVLDGPLPAAPQRPAPQKPADVPVASPAPAAAPLPPVRTADAHPAPAQEAQRQTPAPRPRPVIRPALVRQAARILHNSPPVVHRTPIGDDARVLRDREAWLRNLDRKYGIVR